MAGAPGQIFRCALCGFSFDAHDTACAHGCPLGAACNLTRCPSCGYEFPPEPRGFSWLRGLFRKRAHPSHPSAEPGTIGLADLAEGETVELVRVDGSKPERRNALAVYGVVPGCSLVLQQKRPAYVIRVGETELALEESIAREFLVRRTVLQPNISA